MSDGSEGSAGSVIDVDLLETAVSSGYFEVPRQVSLTDLAKQEGIDSRTASERLRFALDAVLTGLFEGDLPDAASQDGTVDPALVERLAAGADPPADTDRAGGRSGTASEGADTGAPVFRALARPERRRLLAYLQGTARATEEELVDVVAGREAAERGPVGPDRRAAIATAVREYHLPILESAALVARDSGTVSLLDLDDATLAMLDAAAAYDRAANGSPDARTAEENHTPRDA